MIAAAAASLSTCEDIDFALARWVGWSLMLVAVGPVSNAPLAQRFRRSAMIIVQTVIIGVALVSAAWRMAGLPNLGVGDFTGVMWHSMTLGPLAALAGLIALSRGLSRGGSAWYSAFAASVGVVLMASSRSALAGLVLGAMILFALKLKRRPLMSAAILATGLFVAMVPDACLKIASGVLPESLTAGLLRKSWEHSREGHWDARWEEFLYSPITGVGFATGWQNTVGYNEETGAIETGSSYFSILSMTGLLGASAFLLLVSSAALHTVKYWWWLEHRQRLEICGLAGFWFVDLAAEGYIYGVGSLLGLTFWLWLGRLLDQLEEAALTATRALPQRSSGGSVL
jgi:O-antigen ligase